MKTQTVGVELQGEDRKAYRDQGFWIGPRLFDDAAVKELRDAVYRTLRGERDFDSMHWGQPPKFDPQSPQLAHVVNGWWVNAKIRELIGSNEIGYLASQLMGAQEGPSGARPSPLQTGGAAPSQRKFWRAMLAGIRMPPIGTMFNSTTFCTAWIALQDTDLSNGGMCFVRGSHKWGVNQSRRRLLRIKTYTPRKKSFLKVIVGG